MSCTTCIGNCIVCNNKNKRYKFNGYFFEYSPMFGPSLLNKNGEIAKRQPGIFSNFWKATERFTKLTETHKRKHEVIDE
jgi:hypothetical protein